MKKAYSYIRFSSKEQEKGSSLDRQLEAANKWAALNEVKIDTTLNLFDKGLSAYKGDHRKKGALKEFLRLVEDGIIEVGSYLLIENIDRLSREKPMIALDTIRNIVERGIIVLTLTDNKQYNEESLNNPDLYMLLGQMLRAHDESKQKSQRIKDAKSRRREKAERGEIVFKQVPQWIIINDNNSFSIDEYKAEPIRLMFKYREEGLGVRGIMRKLNADPTIWKPENRNNQWTLSGVNLRLRSCSTYGALQLRTSKKDSVTGKSKAVNDGEPIEDYYPPIISKELYFSVQSLLDKNRKIPGNGGGRKDKAYNPFTNIVKCGLCGSALHYYFQGGRSSWKYLRCVKKEQSKGVDCDCRSIRLDDAEECFFSNFEELNLADLKQDSKEFSQQVTNLKDRRKSLLNDIEAYKMQTDQTYVAMTNSKGRVLDFYTSKIEELVTKQEQAEEQIAELTEKLNNLTAPEKDLKQGVDNLISIRKILQEVETEDEKTEIRLKIRHQIRQLVDSVTIYPRDRQTYWEKMAKDNDIKTEKVYRTISEMNIQLRNSITLRKISSLGRTERKSKYKRIKK